MNNSLADLPPQAILLCQGDRPDFIDSSNGAITFRVDLGDVHDTHQLTEAIGTVLLFPHHAAGFDSLLDLMSDLDWFGHDGGYIVEFDGLDRLERRDSELLARLAALLPYLCDRWRSRRIPFRVVLHGQPPTRRALRDAIDAANRDIEQARLQPWTVDVMSVEVIDCV